MYKIHKKADKIALFYSGFFLLIPVSAFADAGIPMLFPTIPLMIMALLPIIMIEAGVIKKRNSNANFWDLLKSIAIANVFSTFIGIPITWIVLVVIQFHTGGSAAFGLSTFLQKLISVTWQAPWLIPYGNQAAVWMIPCAFLVLLIPFFFISWISEYQIIKRWSPLKEGSLLKHDVFWANIVSYVFLALAGEWYFYLKL
jgi:hypothetical protein